MATKNIEQEQDLSKVGNILNAAQKRFGQYGLCKTTMTEIAADLGLSKAALYYYYPDKESLFEAVILKEQSEFIREVSALLKPGAKGSTLLLAYAKKRQDYFNRFMNLSKLRYEAFPSSKPLLCRLSENLLQKEREVVRKMLEIGIANQEFRKVNVVEYADFLIPMMQGLRMYAIKIQTGISMSDAEHQQLNENLKKAIHMFLKDISISS